MASPLEYMDLILVPSILHIDPMLFADYPPALKGRIRYMLMMHIGAGHALNTDTVEKGSRHDA